MSAMADRTGYAVSSLAPGPSPPRQPERRQMTQPHEVAYISVGARHPPSSQPNLKPRSAGTPPGCPPRHGSGPIDSTHSQLILHFRSGVGTASWRQGRSRQRVGTARQRSQIRRRVVSAPQFPVRRLGFPECAAVLDGFVDRSRSGATTAAAIVAEPSAVAECVTSGETTVCAARHRQRRRRRHRHYDGSRLPISV